MAVAGNRFLKMMFLAAVVLFAFAVGGFVGACLGTWLAGRPPEAGQVISTWPAGTAGQE
jgi:hypothetical protein